MPHCISVGPCAAELRDGTGVRGPRERGLGRETVILTGEGGTAHWVQSLCGSRQLQERAGEAQRV